MVGALISYPAGFLLDRLGRRDLLVLSIMIVFITYLGFATTRSVVVIGFLFVFYGFYQAMSKTV